MGNCSTLGLYWTRLSMHFFTDTRLQAKTRTGKTGSPLARYVFVGMRAVGALAASCSGSSADISAATMLIWGVDKHTS